MCKNTKDVQSKKQPHVDGYLFSHPCGLTGQQHCILTAWRDRKRLFDRSAEFPRHGLTVNRKCGPLCKQLAAVHKCLTQL